MDLAKAFLYPFEDADWFKKIALIGLVSLIPIIGGIMVLGWSLDAARRAMNKNVVLLPDLDFETQLTLGLKGIVVSLVYVLPVLLLVIPITVLAAITENNSQAGESALIIMVLCFQGLIFLYALLLTFMLPAAYTNMLAQDRLGAAFDLKKVFGMIRSAPLAYVMVLLGVLVTGFIAPLGLIACLIGIIVTNTYAVAVMGNLYGQAHNEAVLKQAEASALGVSKY